MKRKRRFRKGKRCVYETLGERGGEGFFGIFPNLLNKNKNKKTFFLGASASVEAFPLTLNFFFYYATH